MILAIINGEVTATMMEKSLVIAIQMDSGGVKYIEGNFESTEYAFVFQKNVVGQSYASQMTEHIQTLRADGTLARLESKWLGTDESIKMLEVSPDSLSGTNGTLVYATDPTLIGYDYIKNGKLVGFDIDIAVTFAQKYGYKLEFESVSWGSLLPGITSGKYDIVGACVSATEDRAQSVNFSEVYSTDAMVICVADRSNSAVLPQYTSFEELNNKKIGHTVGASFSELITASGQIENPSFAEYQTYGDIVVALNSGRIDAFAADEPIARTLANAHKSICLINEPVIDDTYTIYLQKNSSLTDDFARVINAFKADGTLDEIKEIWFGTDESKKIVSSPDFTGATPITIAFNGDVMPMSYIANNAPAGFEIELIVQACKELNLKPIFENYPSAMAMISALDGKKADLAIGSLSLTAARQEKADAVPYYSGGVYLLVKNLAYISEDVGFFAGLAKSFYRTFIEESRYLMFLSGLWTTVIITFFATIFGLIGGFGLCCMRKANNKWLNYPAAFFIRLIQGLPMVLFLMILYYLVFINVPFNAVTIAIIGFSINMAAYSSEMMRASIDTISKGQLEAARALGFGRIGVLY